MRIKLIGIGQAGSFIVYDVLAFLFDAKNSKDLRSTRSAQFKQDVVKALSQAGQPFQKLKSKTQIYFTGQKVTELPKFYVIDGNRNNKVVDGIDDLQQKMNELSIHVNSLPLLTT